MTRGRQRFACSKASSTLRPAASVTTWKRSGKDSTTLRVLRPMLPVDPRIAMRFMDGNMVQESGVRLQETHAHDASWRPRVLDPNFRDQSASFSGVCEVVLAEGFAHELLFHAALDPETCREQRECEKSDWRGVRERRAPERNQQPGINGVAHPGVGSGPDQFMPDLDAHGARPVLAEVEAGPNGEANAGCGQDDSGGIERRVARQDSTARTPDDRVICDQQVQARKHWKAIK